MTNACFGFMCSLNSERKSVIFMISDHEVGSTLGNAAFNSKIAYKVSEIPDIFIKSV